jgi:trehalose synthase
VSAIEQVPVGPMDPHRFASVLTPERYDALVQLIARASQDLRGRVIWNVNSTARGGGVVELLRPLLGYSRGAGVDARWLVINAEPAFFAITKRLHNRLHGFAGDGGALGRNERRIYERALARAADELVPLVRPADVVILHDPQTGGLVEAVRRTGATVIWRCHVGRDGANGHAEEAWRFLHDYVIGADAFVFSRPEFVWQGLPEDRLTVIRPSIDVFSPKNQDLSTGRTLSILSRIGVVSGRGARATFARSDGTPGRVDRRAVIFESRPLSPGDALVTQVSRWDRLKDPLGVLSGFVEHVSARGDAHLVLAGPATESVSDDPEGAEVLSEVSSAWEQLPGPARDRVHLVCLPMDDVEENAAMVNALQRHSRVVVQKSLAEGFGLTVAEAMWKARPVVASRIGGIQDQIVDGESGILVSDPEDLKEFGRAVADLLGDPGRAERIGAMARERVRDEFLGPYHLERYFELIARLTEQRLAAGQDAYTAAMSSVESTPAG